MAIKMTWQQIFQLEQSNIRQIKELEEKIAHNEEVIKGYGVTLDKKSFIKKQLKDNGIGRIVLFIILGLCILTFISMPNPRAFLNFMVLTTISIFLGPVIWIGSRILIKRKGARKYSEQYVDERKKIDAAIDKLREEISESSALIENFKKRLVLPEKLRPYVNQICEYFENARADTLEEALELLLKDIKHTERVNELSDQLCQAQDAYNAMEEELEEMRWAGARAEQADNQAIWAELEEEMKYIYNSH